MSVSHPLATDDAHSAAGGAANSANRLRADGPDARAQSGGDGAGTMSVVPERVLVAPEHLGLETRVAFRESASLLIDRITAGSGRLVVDCSGLKSVDSSGINALILIQRRATKRRVNVALLDLQDELLGLLVLTKLDDLFELRNGPAR